jgi:hypothetical protein
VVERRRLIVAIAAANVAAADCLHELAIEVGDDNPVVVRIADEQAIAFFIGENLPRKTQRRIRDLSGFQRNLQRLLVEQLLLPIVGQCSANDLLDLRRFKLARLGPHRFALRIDQDNGGPAIDLPIPPDRMVGVIDYWMFDFIPQDGIANVVGVALRLKFSRMDANDHEVVRKLPFQLF